MKMDEAKIEVSIIVPVYNTEKYLHKCFDSLINQTFENIEIVVINDGSKDQSDSIIQEYKKKYPEKFLVLQQENSGQAVARNRGIQACHGEYITFLDSDDYMDHTMIEKLYDAITKNDLDMVYCDFMLDYGDRMMRQNVKKASSQTDLFVDCLVSPWNKMYRAEILRDKGIRFPEGYFYEDTGWYIETIPYVKKFEKVSEALTYHVVREGSTVTAVDDTRAAHMFSVLEEMLQFYKVNDLLKEWKTEVEFFYSKILLCSSMVRFSRIQNQELRRKNAMKVFKLLKERFPDYKKNPLYRNRGLKMYIKLASPYTIDLVLLALRLKDRLKKNDNEYPICDASE